MSETPLVHFGIRVEPSPLKQSLYLVALRQCTLGDEGLFTSGRRNLGDTRSGVQGDVVALRNTRRMA